MPTNDTPPSGTPRRLIETDAFPFEFLSTIAEQESWRKEIYRPVYHIHKWWAKRLGSIFRGLILGCALNEGDNLCRAFYQKHDFTATTILDPFMGSGTTIGEAHKLGCIALGRDINPVACESVRVALGALDRDLLQRYFAQLSETVGRRIRQLYQAPDEQGHLCDVLYYFWVKQVPCLHCSAAVDLFSTRIFARNAYPDRKPVARICCPSCGEVFSGRNDDVKIHCPSCTFGFNPQEGAAGKNTATCPECCRSFSIVNAVRATGRPPRHRLYAKLLLAQNGEKRYLRATALDASAYEACAGLLQHEVTHRHIHLPDMSLADGNNTKQAIAYQYRNWRDFFNDRQLLALGWLQEAISALPELATRDAFLTLFSGVLEFNNLFASYKGEGTGAVRHMFAHHILKPERMPIEANVWGTSKSSGSFSTLYKTRLLRAVEYREAPFEVGINGSGKRFFASAPFAGQVEQDWPVQGRFGPRGVYLSCGSSQALELPDRSIDFIVTDPPFFDNVHYSELADFFSAWQELHPRGFVSVNGTTRQTGEVQDKDAARFAGKLCDVFSECRRVLKDEGLLVFSYHHSRPEGWTALAEAVVGAGFSILNAHPVKAELSLGIPKSQAKEPIQLDVILVCTKSERDTRIPQSSTQAALDVHVSAQDKLVRLATAGLRLSDNDRRVIVFSQFLAALGPVGAAEVAVDALNSQRYRLEDLAANLELRTGFVEVAGSIDDLPLFSLGPLCRGC